MGAGGPEARRKHKTRIHAWACPPGAVNLGNLVLGSDNYCFQPWACPPGPKNLRNLVLGSESLQPWRQQDVFPPTFEQKMFHEVFSRCRLDLTFVFSGCPLALFCMWTVCCWGVLCVTSGIFSGCSLNVFCVLSGSSLGVVCVLLAFSGWFLRVFWLFSRRPLGFSGYSLGRFLRPKLLTQNSVLRR